MATVVDSDHHHLQQQQQQRNKKEDVNVEKDKSLSPITVSSPLINYAESSLATTTATSSTTAVYDVEHLATFSTSGNHQDNNIFSEGAAANNNDVSGLRESNEITIPLAANTATATTTPKVVLQRLFELEKLSGIWTQRMQIELRSDFMLIVDCETNSIVERFERQCVTKAEAFSHYNDIYNNIVVFLIKPFKTGETTIAERDSLDLKKTSGGTNNLSDKGDYGNCQDKSRETGELHIFHCVSHKAQQIVSDILVWKSQSSSLNRIMINSSDNSTVLNQENAKTEQDSSSPMNRASKQAEQGAKISLPVLGGGRPVVTVASSASVNENVPIINVNVKETVQVFNQIAALREKRPSSPAIHHARHSSDALAASSHPSPAASSATATANNGNGDGNNSLEREPLSPGGQLYKQRSIRATLAPKFAGSSAVIEHHSQEKPTKTSGELKPSSNNAVSSAPSSSMGSSEPKSSPYQDQSHGHHSNGRQAAHGNAHRSPDKAEQIKSSNGIAHNQIVRSSQHQQQALVSSGGDHHKSSKSQSRHSSQQQQQQQRQQRSQTDLSRSHTSSSSQGQLDQVMTNESYVSVLNHCFDDIEKFIIRLQQAVAALRELQARRKLSKRASDSSKGEPNLGKIGTPLPSTTQPMTAAELAMLSARARGPSEDDYFEILSKFKLAFNLLAKLKGCIHEPNAPELVHFLFTPLAIIIESARNATPPIDPTLVGIPYLNQDALDLLSNCCTSKESDMWLSLGPNWTETIDLSLLRASRLPSSFQPIFSDGWAPIIGELELIGLVAQQQLSAKGDSSASHSVKDCAPPPTAEFINGGHNHRYRHHHYQGDGGRRHTQPYALNETSMPSASLMSSGHQLEHTQAIVGCLPAPGGVIDGGSRLGSSKAGGHKKRNAPVPPIEPMESLSPPQQPYLGPAQYGYIHGPGIDTAERTDLNGAYRPVPDHSRNARINQSSGSLQSHRRSHKQSSTHTDYPNYGSGSHYPPMQQTVDDSHLDIDFLAHCNAAILHSDDYTEMHHDNHLINKHPSKVAPGPSHHHHLHHRGESNHHQRNHKANSVRNSNTQRGSCNQHLNSPFEPKYLNQADHEAMFLDFGPAQTDWFFELQARGAMIVRVLFTRDANNEKELSVKRGEILELLDDTRKWWRARNIDLQVAHVPHTIVAIMQGYQTLDELLANNPNGDELSDEESSPANPQRFSNYNQHQWRDHEKRNSKGAFRYF